jgi:hypothetical protein
MSTARLFELPDEDWGALSELEQKVLVQQALAWATVVQHRLKSVQPSPAAYPLMKMALSRGPDPVCHRGSDPRRSLCDIEIELPPLE